MTSPMTTPPLDLPALWEIANAATYSAWATMPSQQTRGAWAIPGVAATIRANGADARHIAAFDPPTALALLDELDKAKHACQTLGRVIDRQCEDALTATDSQDLLWGDDGDGDWGAIWERVLGLGEKAREATARAEAAEKAVERVRAVVNDWDQRYADMVDEITRALDTHTPETETTP